MGHPSRFCFLHSTSLEVLFPTFYVLVSSAVNRRRGHSHRCRKDSMGEYEGPGCERRTDRKVWTDVDKWIVGEVGVRQTYRKGGAGRGSHYEQRTEHTERQSTESREGPNYLVVYDRSGQSGVGKGSCGTSVPCKTESPPGMVKFVGYRSQNRDENLGTNGE